MAAKKKSQSEQTEKTDNSNEVKLRETSPDQLENKTHSLKEKYKFPDQPKLIKLFYKRNKLKKLRCNYGANFDDANQYCISEESAKHYKEKENEQQEQRVRKVRQKDQSKSKKKKWLNFLYFALNVLVIVIIMWVQLSKESNPLESLSVIFDVNWWFILAAFGMFLFGMIMDQCKYSILAHKATGLFRFRLSYKIGALGRHYDAITPLSTGGQPFQIYYMHKYGIKVGQGISIVMGKYIFYQIIYFICVSIVLFRELFTNSLSATLGTVAGGVVSTLSWIGYATLFAVISIVTIISLNRRAGTAFIASILKFVNKIKIGKFKIIKDYKQAFVKVMKTVNSWQTTTRAYSKSFWVIFVNVVASVFFFLATYTMPFFIYCAFNGWDPSVWPTIVTIAVMVDLGSAFNPIPMGVGTADLSFTVLFGSLFATGAQVWALIIWRILAYYVYLLQGFGILTYDYIIGDKRLAKYKEFWQLPFRERVKIKLKIKTRKEKLKEKENKPD